MRATWKGFLQLSLVTVPVKLYSAIQEHRVQFHQLHKEDRGRIGYRKVCTGCERPVGKDDIVRGFQVGKDAYVTVSEAEIEEARQATSPAIEVFRFIDEGQINPIYYADAHYLAPDGEVARQAFYLIHQAMKDTNRVALARAVFRQREEFLVLRPHGAALVAYSLRYPDEIRDVAELEPAQEPQLDAAGLKLAETLISNMEGRFEPAEIKDEYTEKLRALIEAKAKGEKVELAPRPSAAKVVSLMEALQRSVAAVQQPGGDEKGKRATRRGKRAAK
jgi:DNA end-binding protein Ku